MLLSRLITWFRGERTGAPIKLVDEHSPEELSELHDLLANGDFADPATIERIAWLSGQTDARR